MNDIEKLASSERIRDVLIQLSSGSKISYTSAEKQFIIIESISSEQTRPYIAKKYGLKVDLLRTWIRAYKKDFSHTTFGKLVFQPLYDELDSMCETTNIFLFLVSQIIPIPTHPHNPVVPIIILRVSFLDKHNILQYKSQPT